jgi:hypothetical protein
MGGEVHKGRSGYQLKMMMMTSILQLKNEYNK